LDNLKQKIQYLNRRIEKAALKSGRENTDILLVAVSKTVDSASVQMAYNCGIRNFGENRVQELLKKIDSVPQARWHMIGRLQTNKVKELLGKVSLIHSLDRWKLAEELDRRGKMAGIEVPALLQVNISGEEQKAGVSSAEVKDFLDSAGQFSSLRIQGFMTIAPMTDNVEETRPVFRELFELKQNLSKRRYNNVELKYLSMGMSQDYEVAIEEGANIIRVGSALFAHDA